MRNICQKAERGVSPASAVRVTTTRKPNGFRVSRLDFAARSCYVAGVLLAKGFCLIRDIGFTYVQLRVYPRTAQQRSCSDASQ
ncbi:MAG TPA: hypothetical protein PLI09_18290 [Candidatus Hydrogenedentes bacterium]|nr:hypothetical protein [Candidatus Hydrogenedentota bacterium]